MEEIDRSLLKAVLTKYLTCEDYTSYFAGEVKKESQKALGSVRLFRRPHVSGLFVKHIMKKRIC